MKTTNRLKLTTAAALSVLVWATACQQVSTDNKSASGNQSASPAATAANSPATAGHTEAPKAASDTPPAGSTAGGGSLATPTDAYKTAYAARRDKDVAGLKRVMSKDALEFLGIVAEKSVDDELKRLSEKPQNPSNESRNEKIKGDTATLEYLDEKGNWKTMDFIKEGGDWKLTFPKPGPGEVEVTTKKPN
jgi:hypothetical protein